MRRLLIAIVLVVAACGQATTIDESLMDIESAARAVDAATEPLSAGVARDGDRAALAGTVDPGDPVLSVERTTYDADGVIIEFCRSILRADRYRYSVELRDT